MTLDCVVFNKNEIYLPISYVGKLSSDYGLLSKTKFNSEDLYLNIRGISILGEVRNVERMEIPLLNIKQCILILLN